MSSSLDIAPPQIACADVFGACPTLRPQPDDARDVANLNQNAHAWIADAAARVYRPK
jgi:hypothetical protein